jgi:hypothetical protein
MFTRLVVAVVVVYLSEVDCFLPQVFTDSFDSIPSHRRLRLFSNLLTILRPLDSAHVLASLLASGKGVAKAGGKQTVLSFMGAVYAQINPKVQLSSLVLLMGEVGQDGDDKDVIIMQILVKVAITIIIITTTIIIIIIIIIIIANNLFPVVIHSADFLILFKLDSLTKCFISSSQPGVGEPQRWG